jgi:hypothetical protein
MRFAWTVAVLATDGEFCKRRFSKTAVPIQNRTRLPTMAHNTTGKDWAAEQAAEKRSFPVVFLSVERMRRDF